MTARADASISYAELKKHASYEDAWISVHGTVYDITKFIEKHPFGDTFRGNLGTECGGLFSSAHVNTSAERMLCSPEFRGRNEIRVVGRLDPSQDRMHAEGEAPLLDRVVFQPLRGDAFWEDLRSEVRAYLKKTGKTPHYSFGQGLLFVGYYFSIYLGLSYLAWGQAWLVAAALLGLHMLCASAHVAHMATHYGFTRHYWLNFAAANFFDLGGLSWLEWQIAHQTHHNQPHSFIDYQTNEYDRSLGVRIHRYVKLKTHHRFQHVYFWIAISLYLPFRLLATSCWLIQNRQFVRHGWEVAAHVAARAILFAQILCAASLHGWATTLALLTCYSLVYSYAAFILLYNDLEDAHKVLDADEDVRRYHGKMSWAEVQVRTSNNWYPTNAWMAFIEFHYGYFNYHIEHHLFPTFKPTLMRDVSPIVRRICQKHGVPYHLTTFLHVQKSLHQHIRKMGEEGAVGAAEPVAG